MEKMTKLLSVLVVLSSADTNECANEGAYNGRHLRDYISVAPSKNLVEANISRGTSGDADKHQPLEDVIYFIGELHIHAPFKFSISVLITAMSFWISPNFSAYEL